MNHLLPSLLFFIALMFALSGCSQAPKQYVHSTPESIGKVNNLPSDVNIKVPKGDEEPSDEDDKKARANSLKPIKYGEGAAGIKFSTTFSESQKILSKPYYGPDGSGLAAYSSGVYVIWDQASQTPEMMIITGDYRGSLEVAAGLSLKTGQDLSSLYSDADPLGLRFLVSVYNQLEGKESDFNCLEAKLCTVSEDDENITYQWHKLILLVSKDRHVLYRMALVNQTPKGKLDNDFDVIQGAVLISDEEQVGLGQKWADTKKITGLDGGASIATNYFLKRFDGIAIGINRTVFDVGQPGDDEKLKIIAISSGFNKKFRFNKKLVKLAETGGTLKLELVDSAADDEKTLDLQSNIAASNQETFLNALTALMKTELEKEGGTVREMAFGKHKPTKDKQLNFQLVHVNEDKSEGKIISFQFETRSGNISYVQVSKVFNAAAIQLLGDLNKVVSVKESELGGLKLGSQIILDSLNTSLQEATLNLGEKKVRADHVISGTLTTVNEQGKKVTKTLQIARFGDLGINLGINMLGFDPAAGAVLGEIVSLSTGSQVGVKEICGLNVELKVGEKDTSVKSSIDDAIKSSGKECGYYVEESGNGSGLIQAIHIPSNKMSLNFSDRALSSITIYDSEVQQ